MLAALAATTPSAARKQGQPARSAAAHARARTRACLHRPPLGLCAPQHVPLRTPWLVLVVPQPLQRAVAQVHHSTVLAYMPCTGARCCCCCCCCCCKEPPSRPKASPKHPECRPDLPRRDEGKKVRSLRSCCPFPAIRPASPEPWVVLGGMGSATATPALLSAFSPSSNDFVLATADGRLRTYDAGGCGAWWRARCCPDGAALGPVEAVWRGRRAAADTDFLPANSHAGTGRLKATLSDSQPSTSSAAGANGHLTERHTCLAWAQVQRKVGARGCAAACMHACMHAWMHGFLLSRCPWP